MNSAGDVVGWWGGVSFPFVWTPQDGFVTLEGMPYAFGSASDINSERRIVGTSFTYTDSIAFAYQDGKVSLLPPMFGGGSSARAINDAGQVAGSRSIWIDDEPYNAFVWSPEDSFTDLGVMNGPNSTCTDINDLGDAVGWTGSYFTPTEAFLWHDGRLTLLGPVPGGTSSSASAVNNLGQIAISGRVRQGDSTVYRAFLWRAGEWMEMGILPGFEHCSVYDVNDSGVAVGRCWNSYPNDLAEFFVWQDGVMTPMDDLLPWDAGVRMSEVATINSAGQSRARAVPDTKREPWCSLRWRGAPRTSTATAAWTAPTC